MKGVPPEHSKFKKGQSGNPNGRPKKLPALDKIMADVLGDDEAAKAIITALQKRALKGDTRAAEILLDRGWGKVRQPLDLTHHIIEIIDPDKKQEEE